MAVQYYGILFHEEPTTSYHLYLCWAFPSLLAGFLEELTREVSPNEVKQAMFGIGSLKAPGPDGRRSLREVNDTLLCLLPKVDTPQNMSQFRPLGLCNVSYKLITKLIVNRLKMPVLIYEAQTSFVPGRRITEHIIIAQKIMHSFHVKKGKTGLMAIKVDLEKAYDKLCWSFIRDMLVYVGIPNQLVVVIMECLTTSHMNVLWNGNMTEEFQSERGVRQKDPLSPYLFVLCVERLS